MSNPNVSAPMEGMPQSDGSLFLVPASNPPEYVYETTLWGPGRTIIYPWQKSATPTPYPPTVAKSKGKKPLRQ